jgi:hypothetical protein
MRIITIGSNRGNNVVISDPLVSSYHLQIIQDDDGAFRVVDCDSENGTFVNGVRVHGEMPLNRYDAIRIGNINLPWIAYFPEKVALRRQSPLYTVTVGQPQPPLQPQIQQNFTINSCTVCSAGLLVAFFLPWIVIPFGQIRVPAYEIPSSINTFYGIATLLRNNGEAMLNFVTVASYSLYLIPLFAVISLLSSFGAIGNRRKHLEFGIALIDCIVLAMSLFFLLQEQVGTSSINLFAYLGPGFYITVGVSIWGLSASVNNNY